MPGLLTRRASRNKMDCDRNDGEYAKNVFRMSGQTWWLDGDGHGPMTRKAGGGLWETIGPLRWATGVKLGDSVVNVVECHQEKPAGEAYYGQFATDLDVGKAVYAQKVAEWGRRRWTVENSFKTQKSKGEDGFGLEHTFCNDENASRATHLLMQFAHNLWQVFNSGMLRRLARGCRKVTQSMWARKLCEALHNIDFSGYEPETVYLRSMGSDPIAGNC